MPVSELIARLQKLIADNRIKPDYAVSIWVAERNGSEAYDIKDSFDIDDNGNFIAFHTAQS